MSIRSKPKVYIKTFGCRSNLYDTQVIISNLDGYEITSDEAQAHIIIINSCTVTNKSDKEARSYARRHASIGKRVVFTGCGVKSIGKELFDNNLAHSVFAHSHKENVSSILDRCLDGNRDFLRDRSPRHIDTTVLPKVVGKVRGFVKIQEGCNFSCSYCIIPSVRGMSRSFGERSILDQVRILAQSGVSEIILTGTNIGSYGTDTGCHIADLVTKISEIDGINRIRLGSLEPSQIDIRFLSILDNEKLERHLHIALQHTSPRMLRIMNRKNTFESDLSLFDTVSRSGFAIGTDYIVAHHGETEDIFQEALDNLHRLPLTHIHPFVYSPRSGTVSATNKDRLPSVRGDVAKQRLKMVQNVVKSKNLAFRKQHMGPLQVLIDGYKEIDGIICASGLDEYFNRIYIAPDGDVLHGTARDLASRHASGSLDSDIGSESAPISISGAYSILDSRISGPSPGQWVSVVDYEVAHDHNRSGFAITHGKRATNLKIPSRAAPTSDGGTDLAVVAQVDYDITAQYVDQAGMSGLKNQKGHL